MDDTPEERIRRARETLEVLQRAHPSADPQPEDVAALHELHAEHESARGRFASAALAKSRAERARRGCHSSHRGA